MLPYQTPNLLPGRHQRQKSTPAIFDTPRTLLPATQQQHEPHKRGLSLGQAITPHENNGLSQQDDNLTYDEYMDRQRLIQALMREAQQQQQTARPGQENQLNTQQESYQNSIQQAPCQEHGTGSFAHHLTTNPMTAWDHPNKDKRLSLQDTYRAYATDMFQPFDPTPSAGNLDGFGPGHDGNAESIQPNEIQNTKEMPRGIPSRVGAQTSSEDEVRRPCTPISQTRISQ